MYRKHYKHLTAAAKVEVTMLKDFLEHAPRDPGPHAADLRGWKTPLHSFVCVVCAGRIMARGCFLPKGSEPVYGKAETGSAACCLC